MWKYNESKHQLEEQPTMKEPDEHIDNFEYKNYMKHIASLRILPCHESLRGKWKDGEEVVEGKGFLIDSGSANTIDINSTGTSATIERSWAIAIPTPQQTERMFTLEEAKEIWMAGAQYGRGIGYRLPINAFQKQQFFKQKFNIDITS